jgi:hypothetical protein
VSETPEQNSKRLLELMTEGFLSVRERTDEQCTFVGRFFSAVLLIESKLVRLLASFDPDIEERMLGGKLRAFKDFLKSFRDADDEFEIDDYRRFLAALNEIKDIRNAMAHDLTKTDIDVSELRQTHQLIQRLRPDMCKFDECESENVRSLAILLVFTFVFCAEIAKLQIEVC